MSNIVKYLGRDENDEMEFYISINGQKIIVFNNFGTPYKLVPEENYLVDFSLFCLNDCQIEVLDKPKYGIEKIYGDYYGYYLYGMLSNGKLDLKEFIMEDTLFEENNNLNGRFVKIKVDRIGISFVGNREAEKSNKAVG